MTLHPHIAEFITNYVPWGLSAVTLWMTLLAGNKHRNAWLVGMFNQMAWLGWIMVSKNWGFLPMNAGLWLVYFRNHVKWNEK